MYIRRAVSFSATLLMIPGVAIGQNFLTNGDFNSNIAGWTSLGSGSLVHDAAAGSPGLGAARVTIPDPSGSGLNEDAVQCVAAASGANYTFSGRALLQTGSATGSSMVIIGQFFTSSNCTGISAASLVAPGGGSVAGTPSAFTGFTLTTTPPAGIHSFRFLGQVQTGGFASGTAVGWVDNLALTSTDVLFVSGFDL